jgi:hypothetical protein
MKTVFLESHNIKNRAGGLGTFNYELIKGLSQLDLSNNKIILNSKDIKMLNDECDGYGNIKWNDINVDFII